MKVKNLDRIISIGPAFFPLKMGEIKREKKPLFIMMSGIPGSGKSTKAKKFAKFFDKIAVLSTDDYREKITGNVNDLSRDEEVFDAIYKDMRKFLIEKKSVIYDATNMNIKDRRRALEAVSGINCYKISHLMNVDFKECKKRNSQRDRVLPEEVLYKFLYKFELPTKLEGFDLISLENYSADTVSTSWFDLYFEKMSGFNQKTKWHKHNLLPHCIIAYDYLKSKEKEENKEYDWSLLQAARIHDIGKLYTGQKKEDGDYSYHNHANVGAYDLICNMPYGNLEDNEKFFDIVFYVNHHMRVHNWETERIKNKYRKKFGEKYFENLLLLNEADLFASGRE